MKTILKKAQGSLPSRKRLLLQGYSNQAEPQAAGPLNHEEVVTFGHGTRVFHPLENLFFDMAFYVRTTFDFEYLELFGIFFRLAPEAHRASIDRSSPGDIDSHVDSKFVPMHGDIFQPKL